MAIKHPKRDPSFEKKEGKCSPPKKNASNSKKNAGLATLVQKNTLKWSVVSQASRPPVSDLQCGMVKPIDLEQRIKKKIIELVEKEETLVDLYQKAAEASKKREEEFKDKSAILLEQIEKEKSLMNYLRRVN